MKGSTTSRKRKIIESLAALAFWLAVWQLCSMAVGRELLLVPPAGAGARLLALMGESGFWLSVLATCRRVLTGFAAALVVGAVLAALCARLRVLRILFQPLLGIIRSTPVASFIILVLIWMHTDLVPAFIGFVMVVPLVWANLYAGIGGLDRELLEMARLFRFTRRKQLRCIVLPGLMPYFAAACSTGLGFAWKSAIAAEVIARPESSIGREIQNAKIYLNSPDLFAWTIAVVALSVLLEKGMSALLRLLERRLLRIS